MKDSLKLLSRRERKEVLGHRYANLWLLTIVITATFLSIAFSNASMKYLSDKMNDPFTNWVNIYYGEQIPNKLLDSLSDPTLQERFNIHDFQTDYARTLQYFVNSEKPDVANLYGRFMTDLKSDLIKAILSPDNIINGQALDFDSIPYGSYGMIITGEGLTKLKYSSENAPAYIDFVHPSQGADTIGVELYQDTYAHVPFPVIAVVNRLPDRLDYLSTGAFFEEKSNPGNGFNRNNTDYQRQLNYFVTNEFLDSFEDEVRNLLPDSIRNEARFYDITDDVRDFVGFRNGRVIGVYPFGYDIKLEVEPYNQIADLIEDKFPGSDVYRMWKYNIRGNNSQDFKDYISINFNRLDSVGGFANYMLREFRVKVDMAQVNSKENFNAVSVMAGILSWAMIIFAVVCIVLFIVNMLQSYFQKVKRNMGTFKAFGIGTGELIGVYVRMLFGIVVSAIALGLVLAWGIELILPLLGIVKDGEYSYLSLWSLKTVLSAIIMIGATIVTVYAVMRSLLRRTPGDLIYDR